MISVRSGFVVVGCVCVGFVTSAGTGVLARAAEPLRWEEPESASSDDPMIPAASEAQSRIAQLEQRLQELAGSAARGPTSAELDAAIARNNELTARNRTLAAEYQ